LASVTIENGDGEDVEVARRRPPATATVAVEEAVAWEDVRTAHDGRKMMITTMMMMMMMNEQVKQSC
jgi:hypothetical protein